MVAWLRQRPAHAVVLLICVIGVWIHQWVHWGFMIDDAGICFAYARNIAAGEGVVPWPGGERIEAFSNPTWMVLLVGFELIGVPSILVAKPLALLFGALLVPLVYRLAQLALEDDASPSALFAPMSVALSAQFAIWSASALENSLWCVLLTSAAIATVLDVRSGRFARSALGWFLVGWSRPEGLIYVVCGGFWYIVFTLRRGGSTRTMVRWFAAVWLPTYALEIARIWYFAWPLPNTFYGKIVARPPNPMAWEERGWGQIRDYCRRLWQGYYLPVYVVGLLGIPLDDSPAARLRRRIALGVVVAFGLLLMYPAPTPLAALSFWPVPGDAPHAWLMARVVAITAGIIGLPLLAVGGRGWEARVLCWHCAGISVLFSVVANGDWMGGYRWMSLLVPCIAVLLATGLDALITPIVRAADRALPANPGGPAPGAAVGWTLAAFGVCALLPPSFAQSRDHLLYNGDETVGRIRMRAAYTKSIVDRTFYEGPVVNVEMDQGGYLLDRPDFVSLDMAGLVDIPMSHHLYTQPSFIEEWVYREHTPTFAHLHGWWAKFSGLKTYDGFADMVELPRHRDIPPAPLWHDGMWVNRKLMTAPAWTGTARRVVYDTGIVLEGFDVPAELWAQGGYGYIELGFSAPPPRDRGTEPQLVAFLTDGVRVLVSWDLPIGYDVLKADQWREDVVIGRYAVRVPGDVGNGRYDLGLLMLGSDGRVMNAASALPPGAEVGGTGLPPMLAVGELRFPRAIKVASPTDVDHLANSVRDEVLVLTDGKKCERAEARWIDAKRVRPDNAVWIDTQGQEVHRAIADCWALRAEAEPDRAPEWLARAHARDRGSPELARVAPPVVARLWAEGKEAQAQEDWAVAYDRFTAVLAIEPWRSWARKWAEQARDRRLGLDKQERVYVGIPRRPGGDGGLDDPDTPETPEAPPQPVPAEPPPLPPPPPAPAPVAAPGPAPGPKPKPREAPAPQPADAVAPEPTPEPTLEPAPEPTPEPMSPLDPLKAPLDPAPAPAPAPAPEAPAPAPAPAPSEPGAPAPADLEGDG